MHLKVGKQELKRGRTLVTTKGRLLIGHDWLAALQFYFTPANQIAPIECFSMISKKLTTAANSSAVHTFERSGVERAFMQLFRIDGLIKHHEIEFEFIEIVKFTQQMLGYSFSIAREGSKRNCATKERKAY